MKNRRRVGTIAALGALPLIAPLMTSGVANAHGSMENPAGRAYTCYQEGAESPDSAACKAAVQASGPQAIYDWNAIRVPDAAGQHQQKIPDGQLCSAGNPKYKGFDLARADWPAATLPTSGQFDFVYHATAQHQGGMQLYVTKDGYDPTKPLTWADLEEKPFLSVQDPVAQNGKYHLRGEIPQGKTGRHMIYTIWQRSDSPEAFYSCSDVVFGGAQSGTGTGGETAAPTPAPAPPAQDSGTAPAPAAPTPPPEARGFVDWFKSLF